VGHVGGDVNPNHADSEAVLSMASWVLAELTRIFHGVSLIEAQTAVDALVQRRHPLVWEADGIKRVLNPAMKKSDQALVLLYSESAWVQAKKLAEWVEYTSTAMFRTRILKPLHRQRLIEFEVIGDRAKLSPLGIGHVEGHLLRR
jgi:hypothetical protein